MAPAGDGLGLGHRPLRGEPILELRRARNREPLEELSRDQLGRRLPILGARQCLQVVHVHISENDRSTPGEGHVDWDTTFKTLKEVKYDVIDQGNPNPRAETPRDLPKGRYAYFCRIHP